MKRALLALAFLIVGAANAADSPIFPLEDGQRFVYHEKYRGFREADDREDDVVFTVKGTAAKVGDEAKVDVAYPDGRAIALTYRMTADGIALASKRITQSGTTSDELVRAPELFLTLPLAKGATWKYGPFDARVGDDEDVVVPAGKFHATRLELVLGKGVPRPICNVIGMAGSITIWFAPGTGIVKQTWTHLTPVVPARGEPTSLRELVKVSSR